MSTSTRSHRPGDRQLRLIGGERPDWALDARTRRVGLRGVAEAREVLRRARPPAPVDAHPIAS